MLRGTRTIFCMNATSDQDIPRKVAASQGVRWVIEGFRLYRKSPLLLSAAFGLLFGVVIALNLVPGIGSALSELAMPVMVAGFMAAYRALDSDSELELPHFLAGVSNPTQTGPMLPLMTLGAVQLLGTLLIGQIMLGMGFDPEAIMKAAQNADTSPADMQAAMSQALPAVLIGLALFTPLVMATWFAPALILFGGARPLTALGVSLKATVRNWRPMLVNALALGLPMFVCLQVPPLLLIALPVLFASLYASYQAIFAVWADEVASLESLA